MANVALLIHSFIFEGTMPMNISCTGDLNHGSPELHEYAQTTSDEIQDGKQETSTGGKIIDETLCGEYVAIYICMLWMI